MKYNKLCVILGSSMAMALSAGSSLGAPNSSGCVGTLSDANKDYIKKFQGLNETAYGFIKRQHDTRYNISQSKWATRGFVTDPATLKNDARSDYGKHFYSALFLEHGVHFGPKNVTVFMWDGQVGFIDNTTRGFHANEDYAAIARGNSPTKSYIGYTPSMGRWYPKSVQGAWHWFNEHRAEDGDGSKYAQYSLSAEWSSWGIGDETFFVWASSLDRSVTTYCPVYDPSSSRATPAGVAGTMVHEGWHSREMPPMTEHHEQVLPKDGGKCTLANSKDGSPNCDTWYTHGKLEFDEGDTFYSSNSHRTNVGDPNKYLSALSANQIEDEYLCDVADSGQDWLPVSVVFGAGVAAETVGGRFNNIDVPQQSCGLPTPMYNIPVGTRAAECGGETRCNTSDDCDAGDGEICGANGCCYEQIIK